MALDRFRLDFLLIKALTLAGSSDGNDSTVVSGDVDDDSVLVVASCTLLTGESSGRFDLTACADEDDGRDEVDDDETLSLRLRDNRKKKNFFLEFLFWCCLRLQHL